MFLDANFLQVRKAYQEKKRSDDSERKSGKR